jgi:type 1 glutamine amidotransferase
MQRPFLCAICVAVLSCLDLAATPASGATPPPARNRQEVLAVLAQAPKAPLASDLRSLEIVLVANRKDHGLEEHDYPLWMERWKVLLGGKEAGPGQVNLFGPASAEGPPPGAPKVTVQTAQDWLSPEQWGRADLVVAFFGTGGIWNEAKLRDLKAFLDRGGGFVAVHSATIAEQPHARPLAELIGLAWEGGYTLFRHGRVDLQITGREHPICTGLPPRIRFLDETYWPLVGDASRIGLLATADEKAKDSGQLQPEPMFWTCTTGKGRVYSTILGHYTWTFDDPYFRILLLRGMAWAAGESPYRFDPLVLCGARVTDEKPVDTSIAAATPVAPEPQDPNLLLWLDASDKATLTLSTDGQVSAWANKAAKVGHQLTSSGTQPPLYAAKALGGHPALQFDGQDDVLRDAAFGQSAQTWSLALVVTPRSNVGNGQFHAFLATNRPGQQDYQSGLNLDFGGSGTTQFDTLNLEGVKHQGGAGNLRTESAPFGEGQIILLAMDNERCRLWINGREEDSRAANDAVTAMDELRVGGRFFWGREGGYLHGDVSEVLLYKVVLTEPQRAGLYAYLLEKYGSDIKPPAEHTLDEAWDYLPRYDWDLPRRPLAPIDEAIRNSQQDAAVYETLEPRLVEVLANPAATPAAKDFVCRRLAILGSAASVPALAKLLSDERLSNMACFALERIPDSAAQDALRQALGNLKGNLRTGVIHALGNRRSQTAVADFVGLLTDEDPAVCRAAAVALGKIGGPAAAEALTAALVGRASSLPVAGHSQAGSLRHVLAESALLCAEQFRTAGMHAEALALYQRLRGPDVPKTAQLAATRGMLLVHGTAGASGRSSNPDR